ncbi:MAG: MarR family transcriptional regulator [Anaerolineales bacterium]|nr:MarR family transcriptional regulator [Anaerolineales bacterium]
MQTEIQFLEVVEDWARLYFFRSLTEFFNNLKNSDLSLLQAYSLAYLYFKGPTKITELCEHMMVSPGAASQMVDRLEKQEMVKRVADLDDRRVRKVVLLDKGKEFMQESFRFSQNWLGKIPASITPDQEVQVASSLSLLIQSFDLHSQ